VVVFVGGARFKTDMPRNVAHVRGAIKYIKSYRRQLISEGEIQSIVDQIGANRLPANIWTNLKHIRGLRRKRSATRNRTSTKRRITGPRCPKCGSRMQKKFARKGRHAGMRFYGCSEYPACNGLVPID
jgi:hypothetical protein